MKIIKFEGELEKVTNTGYLVFITGFDGRKIDFYYYKPNPNPNDRYNCMVVHDFTYCRRNYKEFRDFLAIAHNMPRPGRVICRDPYTGDRYTQQDINNYLKFAIYGND